MDIIKEVLRLHPNDISAIVRLNGMLVKPADRYANMRRLLGVASNRSCSMNWARKFYRMTSWPAPNFAL